MTTIDTSTDQPPARGATRRRAWAITALLVVFMLINFGDKAVLGLAADAMMRDLGMSSAQYGVVASAFYALFSVSAVAVGFYANRRSNKWIIFTLAALWAVTQVPIFAVASVGAILASRVVLGAAEGPANPLAVNAAQRWFPDEARNLPTSLVNLGAALGVVTMAPLLTWLITSHGWRSGFVLMCVVGVVWATVWAFVGRDGDVGGTSASLERAAGATVADEGRAPYRAIFLSGTGLSIFVAGFVVYWGLALLVAWVPVYLGTPLGLGARTAGTLVVLPWVVGAVVLPLQGWFSDRLMQRGVGTRGARAVLSGVAILVAAGAMVAMVLVPSTGAKVALLAVAFSVGTVQIGVGMTLMAEITPLRQRAAALGTVTAVTGLSGLVAPALTGRMVEAHGAQDLAGYEQAFLLTAALLVVGGLVNLVLAHPARDAARVATAARAREDGAGRP